MSSLIYFAHNGIDHATQAEASSHQSSALLWIAVITLATVLTLFFLIKLLSKQEPGEKENES